MKYTDDVNHMLGDHFGMFIHYGLYSVLGGEWKGKIATEHALGEWIMWSLRIPLAEYKRLTEEFIPDPDYAEKIVLAAKNAGMRYIVITTKHHDGFACSSRRWTVTTASTCADAIWWRSLRRLAAGTA